MINNNNSNLIIPSDEINNTNLDLFKNIINDKESSYLKNDNKLIEKNKVIENKNIDKQFKKLDFNKIYNTTFGIINIGLTCYINSVIQILIHTYTFLENFKDKVHIIEKNNNTTSYYFYKMLSEIHKNNNSNVIDISEFINFFKNIHPNFGGINQFDSSEFLRVLLEDINAELNEASKGINHILLENDNNKNKLILSKEYKQNFFDKESSIISKYFYSQTISIYS